MKVNTFKATWLSLVMFFKNNPTKEKIIGILANKWPLSITEIRHETRFDETYPFTRQCVTELLNAKILQKVGFKYKLSFQWLQQIHGFSKKTLLHYQRGIQNNLLNKETTIVHINSLEELGNFMLESLENRLLEKKDKQGFFCMVTHLWIPFVNREKLRRLLTIKEDVHVVYTRNFLLDKVLAKVCYKNHVTSLTCSPRSLEYDFFLYNNCVFQIYFPKELISLMDALYSNNMNLFTKVSDLFTMTYKEFPIKIIITRNKEVAKKHREIVRQLLK